ncbi:Rieske 2Fe-2S domain-containing protein [Pseudomonas sp. NPDC007930]|uniref:aromatic ring-hydroxylating oxygenase subunit alpha n=1 Tax=Pseudomonas sp. NPDC007930 TaxID=3364417 RepID=UPI0036E20D74
MQSKRLSIRVAEVLFTSHWHLVGHESELSEDKAFIRFDVLGTEIVISNDRGNLVAFNNRCPHRGARFFMEDTGQASIRCQYHGWGYVAGKIKVPNAKTFGSCQIENADLQKYKISKCAGFIFVAIDPCQLLEDQLGELVVCDLRRISAAMGERTDFNRYSFGCDWPLAIENALEPYHIPMVHTDSLGSLKLGVGENNFEGVNSIWRAPILNEKLGKRLDSMAKWFMPHEAYKGYQSYYIFPFSMISSTCGYSYSLQNFFPSVNEMTFFTSRFYNSRVSDMRYSEMAALFGSSSAKMNRQIFLEDNEVCKRLAADTWSLNPPRYVSSLEDKILHFRRSCREACSADLEIMGSEK